MSRPRKLIVPSTMRAGSSSSRMIDFAVTLLPEPDSPTMPSVSPGRNEKLTPSTARTTPVSVKNHVCRFSTWRLGSAASRMRIKPVADAVTDEVEADHHGEDGKPGECRDPPLVHQLASLGDHGAPLGRRRHDAQAEKGKAGEH